MTLVIYALICVTTLAATAVAVIGFKRPQTDFGSTTRALALLTLALGMGATAVGLIETFEAIKTADVAVKTAAMNAGISASLPPLHFAVMAALVQFGFSAIVGFRRTTTTT